MVALTYVGKAQTNPSDLVNLGYLTALLGTNMSQGTVDSMLSSGFSSYVTRSYVDTQDALNATKTFIDTADGTRLHLSQKSVNSGIAALDGTGRIASSRINVASTQRWPKPFITPSAYNSLTTATGTEVQLYTCAVADPGYTYKLLVTGLVDAFPSIDGEFPVIRVRQGTSSGQLVATGGGLNEGYTNLTSFTTAGTFTYTVPAGVTTLDVVAIGGGGEGIRFGGNGSGGPPGAWVSTTFGTGGGGPLSPGTNISVRVGVGGATQVHGPAVTAQSSVVTYPATGTAVYSLTAAAGAGSASGSYWGNGPGNTTFDGTTYIGGAQQFGSDAPGNAPGGAGSSDTVGAGSADGGAGAPGAVFIRPPGTIINAASAVNVVPSAFNAQTAITGATILYVMLVRSGAASTVTATTVQPHLFVVPVAA